VKLLEGTVVNVPLKEDVTPRPKICRSKYTKHLFIAGGAFDGIERIISLNRQAVGYSTSKTADNMTKTIYYNTLFLKI
jgi:ATP-dependent Clp protease ATP-binding subunit ClpX